MKIPLTSGAYEARDPIASAQSCINLYMEPNPQDAPFPMTAYPSPGTALLSDFTGITGATGPVRGVYDTSYGIVVVVVGTAVLNWLGPGVSPVVVGQLVSNSGNPVSICDNGTTVVIVDGSANGYMVPITSLGTPGSLVQISDPAFYGANRVDFIDTFLVFNRPATNQFYISISNAVTPFNPLYFASKEGWNDLLVTLVVLHDVIWLLGNATTETWYNTGAADFPFQRMAQGVIQQGCVAAYSPVVADNAVYWLSQDRWGRNMAMRGQGYDAKRVSNFAVEHEWSTYSAINDCIGMVFQQGGHETVCFYFPSGNAWWTYGAATGQWHKRTYNGTTDAWLPYCMCGHGSVASIGNVNDTLAGDRTGPRLLQVSPTIYTDDGVPIVRQRSWPHVLNDQKRLAHNQFVAAMPGTNLAPDAVSLSWSDDGGQTFGTPVAQTTNNATTGQYSWRRLGMARDRVYQLQWTATGETALNGAWLEATPADT